MNKAVNSRAECHEAKTVDTVQSTTVFEAELSPQALLMATKKVQEPERKWVGGKKSPKERSFLKLSLTVQWPLWSSAGPHQAEKRETRLFSVIWAFPSKHSILFILFITTGVILVVFIYSFMYSFHAVLKKSEVLSPGHIMTGFLIPAVE